MSTRWDEVKPKNSAQRWELLPENGTHPATLVPIFERAVEAFYADAPA
ncbi:hypothetical protein [Arthrobacter sp. E3]|nr:hypothetical protein [Arthrobacter sp. E3]